MGQCLWISDGASRGDVEEGSVSFVGAGAVLRCGGFTILTDPTFLDHGDHVHLGYGLGSGRPEPTRGIEDPPGIDLVLVSHLCEDPLAPEVERELDRRLPILTTPRAAKTLRQRGFVAARGLAAWETISVERAEVAVRVTAMPGQHGPLPDDFFLPDSMAAMLEFSGQGEAGLRLYVSGDEPRHEDLRALLRREPGVDLVLFRLGGTRVLGVPEGIDEEQGAALRLIGPRLPVPTDGDGVSPPPLEELARALRQRGLGAHVHSVVHGERYVWRPSELSALPAIPPEAAIARVLEAGDGDRPVVG